MSNEKDRQREKIKKDTENFLKFEHNKVDEIPRGISGIPHGQKQRTYKNKKDAGPIAEKCLSSNDKKETELKTKFEWGFRPINKS